MKLNRQIRILCLMLVGIFLLVSAACGGGAAGKTGDETTDTQSETTTGEDTASVSKFTEIGPDDRCITPEGAGNMDGTSWDNAYKGNAINAFQTAWDATGESGTLYIGSGEYSVGQTIEITSGGKSIEARKVITGLDTGSGLPLLKGSFDVKAGFDSGEYFVHSQSEASYWAVKNIDLMNYRAAVFTEGKNIGYHLDNINITNTRDGFYLKGGGIPEDPDGASNNILIENCDVRNNHFRGFRFRDGNYNVKIKNCTVDGGGKENYVDGGWPFGFQFADSAQTDVYEHDFEITDCSSNNNYMEVAGGYWNGDGFVAERMTKNLKYVRCTALYNTDGGWDDKSLNPVLEDCVAIGNKRNFRFWADPTQNGLATMKNCLAAYAHCFESDAEDSGVWVAHRSALEAYNCTFFNNNMSQVMPESTKCPIKLVNCIVATEDGVEDPLYYLDYVAGITFENTAEYVKGVKGEDPQLKNPIKDWDGKGDNFNSRLYGKEKGFYRE